MVLKLQVWLEPVNAAHIIRANFVPDVDGSTVSVLVDGSPSANGMLIQVGVFPKQ